MKEEWKSHWPFSEPSISSVYEQQQSTAVKYIDIIESNRSKLQVFIRYHLICFITDSPAMDFHGLTGKLWLQPESPALPSSWSSHWVATPWRIQGWSWSKLQTPGSQVSLWFLPMDSVCPQMKKYNINEPHVQWEFLVISDWRAAGCQSWAVVLRPQRCSLTPPT